MRIPDFETDFIDSKHDITPNKLLIGLLQNGVAGIHDREIHLADYEHLQFLQLLKKRKKTPFVMNQMSVVGDIHSSIPHCKSNLQY